MNKGVDNEVVTQCPIHPALYPPQGQMNGEVDNDAVPLRTWMRPFIEKAKGLGHVEEQRWHASTQRRFTQLGHK